MSEAELKNKEFLKCCQPLTDRDRRRLKALADHELYGETVRYMLDHNVKLEQEIISYAS